MSKKKKKGGSNFKTPSHDQPPGSISSKSMSFTRAKGDGNEDFLHLNF